MTNEFFLKKIMKALYNQHVHNVRVVKMNSLARTKKKQKCNPTTLQLKVMLYYPAVDWFINSFFKSYINLVLNSQSYIPLESTDLNGLSIHAETLDLVSSLMP
jgi:hypothetical protein